MLHRFKPQTLAEATFLMDLTNFQEEI